MNFSSQMAEQPAIVFKSVSKRYKLFPSYLDHLSYLFRLDRIGIKSNVQVPEHYALRDINLIVSKGQRIGIVGRNGSGKTTLLKLICQAIAPSSGRVVINGNVQALLNVGLGFHMEDSGYKNIVSSLSCSGFYGKKLNLAIEDIIEFCELGDYLYQPIKTYSLGMQSRLMFATSTAITPDILIIDEMLGAGDAYFLAKSKYRITNLIKSGCTVLVVSHSMAQILELCDSSIWIDKGNIRMQGNAFSVVKAYEEYLYGPIHSLDESTSSSPVIQNLSANEENIDSSSRLKLKQTNQYTLLPIPQKSTVNIERNIINGFSNIAEGGISRWTPDSPDLLEIVGFKIYSDSVNSLNDHMFTILSDIRFSLSIKLLKSIRLSLRYGLVIQDALGTPVATFFSPEDSFDSSAGSHRLIDLDLTPCQLGPGDYIVGISIHPFRPITFINDTPRLSLMSRSFRFSVVVPDSYKAIASSFVHPCSWTYGDPN